MVNKQFYNTVLCLTFSPCGNYLIVGDINGDVSVIHLNRLMNPDTNLTKQDSLPKNVFTVKENVQVNSFLTTNDFLLVGMLGEICAYDWKVVLSDKDAKPSWHIELPSSGDVFNKAEVNCMKKDKTSSLLYAGCGDNNIYIVDIEHGKIVRTLSGHTDYVHCLFSVGHDLASGGEDGIVNIWDLRDKKVVNKLEPYKNDRIARPEIGKWIGALSINEDWLLCGGGPKLSLWHFRSLTTSTIFPIDDGGIHVAEVLDDKIIAGGRMNHFYNMTFNGEIVSKIPTSSSTLYAVAYQDVPYKALCLGGSSPKIDICSKLGLIRVKNIEDLRALHLCKKPQ